MNLSGIDFANLSARERFSLLSARQKMRILGDMSRDQKESLWWAWDWWAHPKQRIPDGDWQIWLLRGGRGSGKTRTGAETIRHWVEQGYRRIALLGRTAPDVRDTMLYGESGLLNIGPPDQRPVHHPGIRRVIWPNGAEATLYTAEEPKQLRGPQHEKAWVDELAQFQYPDAWDQLLLGLRLGDNPQVVVTTTPKPTKLILELHKDPTCHVTPMTTYENVQNLAEKWRTRIIRRYEGTRLGMQELYAELLTDTPGALWSRDVLEATRVMQDWQSIRESMVRIVVAIDPPAGTTATERERVVDDDELAECGIVVVGIDKRGHGYTLEDCSIASSKPDQWGAAAAYAFHRWKADMIVAEANQGGEMVGFVLATVDPRLPFKLVWASRGKITRAEPVASLFAQGIAHHVGYLGELEMQETTYVPGDKSPDRMDAEVWGYTYFFFPEADDQVVAYDEEPVRISPF